jgi:L-rhamnose mutarotase
MQRIAMLLKIKSGKINDYIGIHSEQPIPPLKWTVLSEAFHVD